MARSAPDPAHDAQPRLSAHPRARQQIDAAKAWGALILFLLVGFFSMQAGMDAFTVGVRALVAGIFGYVAAWAIALVVWRQVARNEVEDVRRRLAAEAEAAAEAERDATPAAA